MNQNYFEFRNTFYVQNKGLAMGAPTSSALSEIYLQFIELTRIYTALLQNNILGYFRYVDDILTVYNDPTTYIDKVLESFSNATPTMKFTMEKEIDNTINFLDVTVQKRTERFTFNIYRKATMTVTIIPNDTCHPPGHKYAAIHSMINRMNTYHLSKSNKQLECNIIKQIIHNNNYDPSVLDKLNRTKHTTRHEGNNTNKWAKFTYVEPDITQLY